MSSQTDPRAVFVVHGRNESLRKSMFAFLRSINLAPIEWGQAISMTGEGSPYIGQVLDAAFERATAIVVLMTPDEIAYLQPQFSSGPDDLETEPNAQARPNVLFEAGMALGRNAKQTVLVEIGDVRPFSDVGGRHVVRLTNDVSSRQALAERLRTAGSDVDLSGTEWHSTGDFTAPPAPGGGRTLGRRVPSNAEAPRSIDFHLNYFDRGGNRVCKLQVINRGIDTATNVTLSIPEDAALDLLQNEPIAKIPGGGRSVTIDVMSYLRMMGGSRRTAAFDVSVTGHTEDGEVITQTVFLDMNG